MSRPVTPDELAAQLRAQRPEDAHLLLPATPEQAHDVLVAFVLWWQHRHPCQHPTTADVPVFLAQWTPPVTGAVVHRCVVAAYNDRVELADGTAVYLQRDEFGGSLEVGGGAGGVARAAYDPQFGDERECACGHSYRRHFDTYANMRPVGCKYCGCATWQQPMPLPTQCGVCGEQYVGELLEAATEHRCPLLEEEPPQPPVRCVPCPGECDATAQAECYEAQTGKPRGEP